MKPNFDNSSKRNGIAVWMKQHALFLYSIPIVLLVLALVVYTAVVKPVFALRADALRLVRSGETLETAFQNKDFDTLKHEILALEKVHSQLEKDFEKLAYLKIIPIASGYYHDGVHAVNIFGRAVVVAREAVLAVEPHRVLFGFETDSVLTAEQQLLQIAQITPQLIPVMESLKTELAVIERDLAAIDISRYPQTVRGIDIHALYTKVHTEVLPFVQKFVTNIEPALPEIPKALGSETPANYLFIFQNDKEIRPSGGFITAYAIVTLEAGAFKIHESGDIYDIDPERSLLPMPAPIAQYLGVTSYNMRDTNFSPDFQQSMEWFELYYPYTGLPQIEGIIALDTQFLEALLEFLGPVDMPKYSLDFANNTQLPDSCRVGGSSFTSENVVCRLELYAQRILDYHNDRKQILGDLMDELVEKIFALQSDKLPSFLNTVVKELDEKHMLVYLHSAPLQQFVESFNWAGKIDQAREGVDYLHISDANLAGRKSDMYLIRTVDQKITIADDGIAETKITLSYTNPKPQDNWLNNVARNYVRLYVPLGAELLSTEGDLQQVPVVTEDLGKTVFDTFVAIPPLESRTVSFTYRLPFKINDTYRIDMQKQPGKDRIAHTLTVNGVTETFELATDQTFEVVVD